MNYCKDIDSAELYVESVTGQYDKHFGHNFTGKCILTGHPVSDHYIGIYYVHNLGQFFIRLVDDRDSVNSYTYPIEANKISKSLHKILVYSSALNGHISENCPKKLILKGFKAK